MFSEFTSFIRLKCYCNYHMKLQILIKILKPQNPYEKIKSETISFN
jgi:hypothetical protein